jgi:hypothetical protein
MASESESYEVDSDQEDSSGQSNSEESSESDSYEKVKKPSKPSNKLIAEDENDKFRSVSRTKTPFFMMSEPDTCKEGLDLIKEISGELDEIFNSIPKSTFQPSNPKAKSRTLKPNQVFSDSFQASPIHPLPRPTRRNLEQDSERWVVYKSSVPNDFSSNKTFSFS